MPKQVKMKKHESQEVEIQTDQLKLLAEKAKKEADFYAYLMHDPETRVRELANKDFAGYWQRMDLAIKICNKPHATSKHNKEEFQQHLNVLLELNGSLWQAFKPNQQRFEGFPEWEKIYQDEIRKLDASMLKQIEFLRLKIRLIEEKPAEPSGPVRGFYFYFMHNIEIRYAKDKGKTQLDIIRNISDQKNWEPKGVVDAYNLYFKARRSIEDRKKLTKTDKKNIRLAIELMPEGSSGRINALKWVT